MNYDECINCSSLCLVTMFIQCEDCLKLFCFECLDSDVCDDCRSSRRTLELSNDLYDICEYDECSEPICKTLDCETCEDSHDYCKEHYDMKVHRCHKCTKKTCEKHNYDGLCHDHAMSCNICRTLSNNLINCSKPNCLQKLCRTCFRNYGHNQICHKHYERCKKCISPSRKIWKSDEYICQDKNCDVYCCVSCNKCVSEDLRETQLYCNEHSAKCDYCPLAKHHKDVFVKIKSKQNHLHTTKTHDNICPRCYDTIIFPMNLIHWYSKEIPALRLPKEIRKIILKRMRGKNI